MALRSKFVACAAVGLVAALGSAWVLELPFQLDDYTQLPRALAPWNSSSPSGRQDFAREDASASTPEYLFRPVLWALWRAGAALDPPPIGAPTFHALGLLVHVAVSVVLAVLLARRFGAAAALVGGLAFAIHPAGIEAVSWVAANGDALAVLGMLAAALPLSGRRLSLSGAAAAGLAVALAFLAKESAVIAVPFGSIVVASRVRERRLPALAAFLVPFAAAWCWRAEQLGTFSLGYAGGSSINAEAIPRMLRKVPDLLVYLVAPLAPARDGGSSSLFVTFAHASSRGVATAIVAGLLLLPVGAALLLAPRVVIRPVLGLLVVFLVVLVPPAFAAPTLRGAVFSRSLYPVVVPLAAALGVAGAALRTRLGFPATAVILLMSSVPVIDFSLQTRRAHTPLPALVATRFAAIAAAAADAAPGSVIVAAGHDDFRQPWPVLGGLLDHAFRPPFRDTEVPVVWFRDAQAFLASPLVVQWPGPLVLLVPDGDGYRRAGPPLPPLGAGVTGVRLVETNPETPRWLAEPPVPARAVRAIGCDLPAGETARVRLVVETEDGEFVRSASLAASASPRRLGAVFDGDLAYAARSRVVAVRVEGLRPLRAPELLPEAPVLAFRGPLQGSALSLDALPEFRFGPQPKGVILRVDVEMLGGGTWWPAMTYTLFADALPRDPSGELVFVPGDREPRTSPLHPLMRFGYLRPLYEQFLASFGLERLRFRARASAFAGTAETEISRSAWITFDALP